MTVTGLSSGHDKNILPPGAEGIECAVVSGAEGANPPLLNWAAYGESMGREAAEKAPDGF